MDNPRQHADLDGLNVYIYRNSASKLVVEIDTSELSPKDNHLDASDIPNIRIRINEQGIDIGPTGELNES